MSQLILLPFWSDDTVFWWASLLMLKLYSLPSPYTNTPFEKKNWWNLALKGSIFFLLLVYLPPECGISQRPVAQSYKYQCQMFTYFALKIEMARFYEMSANKSITTLCYHSSRETRSATNHKAHKTGKQSSSTHSLPDCLHVPFTGCGCMIMTKTNCFSTGII
jgi:hypothetical protein